MTCVTDFKLNWEKLTADAFAKVVLFQNCKQKAILSFKGRSRLCKGTFLANLFCKNLYKFV